MSFLEFHSWLSQFLSRRMVKLLIKPISHLWHVITGYEKHRLQTEVELRKIDASLQIEILKIENADKQHKRQTQLEEKKECLKFVTENHLSKTISKELVVSLLSAEALQEPKPLPLALSSNGSATSETKCSSLQQ